MKPPTAPRPKPAVTSWLRLTVRMALALPLRWIKVDAPYQNASYPPSPGRGTALQQRAGRIRSTHRTRPALSFHPEASDLVVLGLLSESLFQDPSLAGCEGAEDPLEIVYRGKLDDDLSLLLTEVDLHSGLEAVGEP